MCSMVPGSVRGSADGFRVFRSSGDPVVVPGVLQVSGTASGVSLPDVVTLPVIRVAGSRFRFSGSSGLPDALQCFRVSVYSVIISVSRPFFNA